MKEPELALIFKPWWARIISKYQVMYVTFTLDKLERKAIIYYLSYVYA